MGSRRFGVALSLILVPLAFEVMPLGATCIAICMRAITPSIRA